MIYSIYKESTAVKEPEVVDYFKESKDYGIQIPEGMTSSQMDTFMAGVAEAAMVSCFEKIGVNESEYFTEADDQGASEAKKKNVFEAIKGLFGKMLDVAKNFFGGIIKWFAEKISNFKDQFTKEGNFKILEKQMADSKFKFPDDTTVIYKSKIINPNAKIEKDTEKYYNSSNVYNGIFSLTMKVDSFDTDEALSKAAFAKAGVSDANTIKEFKQKIVEKYTGEYEITWEKFFDMFDAIKAYVINGSQKNTIKKLYSNYKKNLNDMLSTLKGQINKDNKENIHSKIAKVKDLALILDTYGRTFANLEQKRYLEAMSLAVVGVKNAGKLGKRQTELAAGKADNADKKEKEDKKKK